MTLLYILIATSLITLCVLIGVAFMFLNHKKLKRVTMLLVSLSAGALMGGAFFHLLPEASEVLDGHVLFPTVLLSFIAFFIIEKLIHWQHCHDDQCETHSFGYINLIGDSIHNFIDGVIIASSFLINPTVGIATTLAVAIHEIPQEIGDFGVLIHAGFEKKKALALNYLTSLTVVVGGVVGYFAFNRIESIIPYMLPVAAGGFIYLAASDLVPEMKKESSLKKSVLSILTFIFGIILMYIMSTSGHSH